MKNHNAEIILGVGFVYDNLKLIVTQPALANSVNVENLDVDQEVDFLYGGIEFAYPCEALESVYTNLEVIRNIMGNPNEEIAVVIDVLDSETEKRIENLYNEFQNKYDVVKKYEERGYEIKSIYEIHENITDYALSGDELERKTILEIEKNKFDMDKLISKSNEIISENAPIMLRKSNLVDNVFVILDEVSENADIKYIPFAVYECDMDSEFEGIVGLNGNIDLDTEDIEFGNLNLNEGNSIGYLIKEFDDVLNIKIANYVNYPISEQTLVQIVGDNGTLEEAMKKEIKKYIL